MFITGEIIHNPGVNARLRGMGIRFLDGSDGVDLGERRRADDVVILPAFGVPVGDMDALRGDGLRPRRHDLRLGPERLEERRAATRASGFTVDHPRQVRTTRRRAPPPRAPLRIRRATSSSCATCDEAELVCDYIARARRPRRRSCSGSRDAASPGFDPDRDLERIGVANQTTMLSTESLAIAARIRAGDGRPLGRGGAARALPLLRHDLQRHAGPPGRASTRLVDERARPDDRHRRLQQQQHDATWPRSPKARCRPITSPTPDAWSAATSSATSPSGRPSRSDAGLAARRPARRRAHRGRFDAQQRDRPGDLTSAGVPRPPRTAGLSRAPMHAALLIDLHAPAIRPVIPPANPGPRRRPGSRRRSSAPVTVTSIRYRPTGHFASGKDHPCTAPVRSANTIGLPIGAGGAAPGISR